MSSSFSEGFDAQNVPGGISGNYLSTHSDGRESLILINGFLLEMDELISTDALLGGFVGDGSVDIHGRSVKRAHTGRWKASLFIIGVEIAERLTYAGILANLVIYLTDVKHDSTAAAAMNVNVWNCVASMLPFIGAFVADSYLGRYWTITLSSVIYLMEIAENNCVYRNEIHHTAGECTQILQDVASDPTLPRTKTVQCVVCNHGEVVFFQVIAFPVAVIFLTEKPF